MVLLGGVQKAPGLGKHRVALAELRHILHKSDLTLLDGMVEPFVAVRFRSRFSFSLGMLQELVVNIQVDKKTTGRDNRVIIEWE